MPASDINKLNVSVSSECNIKSTGEQSGSSDKDSAAGDPSNGSPPLHNTNDSDDNGTSKTGNNHRPLCPYIQANGSCYLYNDDHWKQYDHIRGDTNTSYLDAGKLGNIEQQVKANSNAKNVDDNPEEHQRDKDLLIIVTLNRRKEHLKKDSALTRILNERSLSEGYNSLMNSGLLCCYEKVGENISLGNSHYESIIVFMIHEQCPAKEVENAFNILPVEDLSITVVVLGGLREEISSKVKQLDELKRRNKSLEVKRDEDFKEPLPASIVLPNFKLCSFCILPSIMSNDYKDNCNERDLDWNIRKHKLHLLIKGLDADIICLQ